MNREYQSQQQRLEELRREVARRGQQGSSGAGYGSSSAGNYQSFQHVAGNGAYGYNYAESSGNQSVSDPMIYQGVYSPSGFDIMGILIRIQQRPNPTINIGNIDSGAALIVCDGDAPDFPIIYVSEPFEHLTGYQQDQIIGYNCRFLQHPPGRKCSDQNINNTNAIAKRELKTKMDRREECRVRLINFKTDGTSFVNVLTCISIRWDEGNGQGRNFVVGFQADERSLYR